MKFIHTSDRHYLQDGAVQANATVNNAIIARPDVAECFLIDTGDDVDSPTAAAYQTAASAQRELYDAASGGVKTPGNHDLDYAGLADAPTAPVLWADHVEDLTGTRPVYPSMHIVGDTAIISVDTCTRPTGRWERIASQVMATGLIGEGQIARVVEMVERARVLDLHVIIAMHHCPSGGDVMLRLIDREEFGDALDAVGGVELMLTGHLHQKREWSDVYGARFLLASPKTPEAQGYRVIWWCEDRGRFCWEWVECRL